MKRTLLSTGLAVSLLLTHVAVAQTGPSMMLVPWTDEGRADLYTSAFYTQTEANVTGADVDLSIFDTSGRVRVAPDASYNPTIGFSYTRFYMSSSDAALPDHLHDLSVAFGGSFGDVDLGDSLGGEWQMGYTLGLGYAGTAPFNDGDAWYGKGDVFAVKGIDRDTRWLVGLNYDGNRVFLPDMPLPAVSYFGRASETVTYGLGFPFSSLTYKPDNRWTIDIRSAVFFSFTGKVTYKAASRLAFYASYIRRSDAFMLSGGPDNRRLIFSQDKAELGVVYAFDDKVALTLAGGYAFNQEIDLGYDVRDPRGFAGP